MEKKHVIYSASEYKSRAKSCSIYLVFTQSKRKPLTVSLLFRTILPIVTMALVFSSNNITMCHGLVVGIGFWVS